MTKLSVNINKIATLRNSRGGDVPNLLQVASDIQDFGAQGITIHPRPDERHIKYQDARDLVSVVHTEYNIEGNPIQSFIDLVLETKPTQVTLVPDGVDAITSNAGWDTITHQAFLQEVIAEFKSKGIRTSVFIDTDFKLIEAAAKTGADRIEFCDNYSLGGITPSQADIIEAKKLLHIPLHVIIRPRGGNFVYDTEEIEMMKRDVLFCKEHNIDGVVFGILNSEKLKKFKQSGYKTVPQIFMKVGGYSELKEFTKLWQN